MYLNCLCVQVMKRWHKQSLRMMKIELEMMMMMVVP
jgi:hypothetical protein